MSPPISKLESPHICVVIPLYRAQEQIAGVLRGIPSFVKTIVVVDDCSPDDSYERACAVAQQRIHFIRHKQNQGVGGAVLSGYAKAVELGAEIIIKMDSDGQMEPAYITPLIAPILINNADYTKGNRFLHAKELKSMPIIRRIGNSGLSFLTKVASGYWNIFDPTNGYTAIHASIFPMLDPSKIHKRYFFESSMLLELSMVRAVVHDVEIPAKYQDETSSLSEWKSLTDFPQRLLAGFINRVFIQYFVRDFGIFSILILLGSSFITFGLSFGLYHWYLSWITDTAASTGTVMIAVLPFILGFQLLLQALIVDMQSLPTKPIHREMNTIKKILQELSDES